MSLPIYQRVAVTDAGDVIPGAEYTVINENTGVAAPIYSDRTGATLLTAPYFANSVGVIQFYIAQGTTYRVAASGGVGTYTDRYVYAFSNVLLIDENNNVTAPGEFRVGTILAEDGTTTTEPSIPALDQRMAKAWVNFDGTGSVTIRDSYNVSSVTDEGTGEYTINFATAMTNVNYGIAGAAGDRDYRINYRAYSAFPPTTTTVRVTIQSNSGVEVDDTGTLLVFGQ